jgi:hypothetical protein
VRTTPAFGELKEQVRVEVKVEQAAMSMAG